MSALPSSFRNVDLDYSEVQNLSQAMFCSVVAGR